MNVGKGLRSMVLSAFAALPMASPSSAAESQLAIRSGIGVQESAFGDSRIRESAAKTDFSFFRRKDRLAEGVNWGYISHGGVSLQNPRGKEDVFEHWFSGNFNLGFLVGFLSMNEKENTRLQTLFGVSVELMHQNTRDIDHVTGNVANFKPDYVDFGAHTYSANASVRYAVQRTEFYLTAGYHKGKAEETRRDGWWFVHKDIPYHGSALELGAVTQLPIFRNKAILPELGVAVDMVNRFGGYDFTVLGCKTSYTHPLIKSGLLNAVVSGNGRKMVRGELPVDLTTNDNLRNSYEFSGGLVLKI